ncbi:helix-hairpin-helix domain-containing protein [Natrialba magadii]|uniref:helix-hairpin-helix domain-containing protein n=1 Tax=Natrialba magadii TaxID=13769 RepID=UPI000A6D872F
MSKEQFVTEPNEAGSANEWDGEPSGQTACDHEERPPAVRTAIEERAREREGERKSKSESESENKSENECKSKNDAGDDTSEMISLGIGLGIELPVIDEPDEVFAVKSTDRPSTDLRSNSRLDAAQRERLEDADLDPDAVANKEYSYQQLLETDIDEAFADDLRRRLSLPWSFQTDSDLDLDRRSDEVRGLGAAERAWIAASGTDDWQRFEPQSLTERAGDSSTDAESRSDANAAGGSGADGESGDSKRPYPRPTPITAVTGVGPEDAAVLAEAGVTSAERLATIRAVTVARLLDLDVLHVRSWRHNARELLS